MNNCNVWDVVKVPFPYTNRPVHQYRPALAVTMDQGVNPLLRRGADVHKCGKQGMAWGYRGYRST